MEHDKRKADKLFDKESIGGKIISRRHRQKSQLDRIMEEGGMKRPKHNPLREGYEKL